MRHYNHHLVPVLAQVATFGLPAHQVKKWLCDINKSFSLGLSTFVVITFLCFIAATCKRHPSKHAKKVNMQIQYNLSNPTCYQTEKKIQIRQGAGIERLTYPRGIKVTLVSIGIQHTADNGYVNELYIVHTNLFQVKTCEVIISYP